MLLARIRRGDGPSHPIPGFGSQLRAAFGLSLFGFDCVVRNKTLDLVRALYICSYGLFFFFNHNESTSPIVYPFPFVVIKVILDVNYFPSYKELKAELPSLLKAHFSRLVCQAKGGL